MSRGAQRTTRQLTDEHSRGKTAKSPKKATRIPRIVRCCRRRFRACSIARAIRRRSNRRSRNRAWARRIPCLMPCVSVPRTGRPLQTIPPDLRSWWTSLARYLTGSQRCACGLTAASQILAIRAGRDTSCYYLLSHFKEKFQHENQARVFRRH